MEKRKIMREAGLIVFHLIPFVYLLIIYNHLPDVVPTHFDISGEPDDFSSKGSLFWILGLLNGIGYLLFLVIPRIDPKKFATTHEKVYNKIRVGMSVLFVALSFIIVYSAGGDALKGIFFLACIIAGLCIFLGNYFQAVKTNYFIGIRTPWTLHSEEVWRKTHHLTGRLLFFGGLLSVPLMFILPANLSPIAPVSILVGACMFGLIYSFILYKQQKNKMVS